MERFLLVIALWKSPRGVLKRIKSCARWMSSWEAIFGLPIPIALRRRGRRFSLPANKTELTFVSSFSLAMGGRGMAKVRVFWEGDEKRSRRVAAWKKKRQCVFKAKKTMKGMKALETAIVVREGVKEFRMSYLDPQGDEAKWEERWDAKEKKYTAAGCAARLSYGGRPGRSMGFPSDDDVCWPRDRESER